MDYSGKFQTLGLNEPSAPNLTSAEPGAEEYDEEQPSAPVTAIFVGVVLEIFNPFEVIEVILEILASP